VRVVVDVVAVLFLISAFSLSVSLAANSVRRTTLSRIAVLLAVAGILLITLWPSDSSIEHQLVPFSEISAAFTPHLNADALVGVFGNLILFLPFGAAIRTYRIGALPAICAGLSLSVAVEIAQLFIPGRWTAADDVLLNTIGTAAGYAAATVVATLLGAKRAEGRVESEAS
jgi:glycopeptide antibiotics resistance protein